MGAVVKFWGVDNTIPLVRREELIQKGYLRRFLKPGSQAVVLQTCDRYEVYYGHGPVKIQYARRLFEITAGLRSPLLGKTAYRVK
jgi:glutamyl-tRNA reductase